MAGCGFEYAVVVGASSGIGEALARQLAAGGAKVALVARREDKLDRIVRELRDAHGPDAAHRFVHDVLDTEAVPELFQEIARTLGGLDLVVYSSGLMNSVDFDEFDTRKDVEMIEVNLCGAVAWLNPAAERFGRLKSGTIVGISSVAGDRGRSANPGYNTAKAGLSTFLEALRNRVGRHGVKVVTVKPGFVATEMTEGMPGMFWVLSADRAAEVILRKARRGKVNVYVPARWRLVMFVIRSIPSFIFKRLKV